MNVICWNCKGTAGRGFGNLVKDLKKYHDSKLVILMETHTSGVRAAGIIKKLVLMVALSRKQMVIQEEFGAFGINHVGQSTFLIMLPNLCICG